jgi:hypothetical protein
LIALSLFWPAAGSAASASAESSSSDPASTDYLQGVRTQWSVPLKNLGDASELASDSSMRHALVAGDKTFYVAMSAFQQDDTIALDLVVINHQAEEIQLERSDIHLFDASGRLLSPRDTAPEAAARGYQGKYFSDQVPSTLFQDFATSNLDRDLTLSQLQLGTQRSEKGFAGSGRLPRRFVHPHEYSSVQPPASSVNQVVRSVRVGPDEGRAFWAYFQGEEPGFPITAWITLPNGEQLRYQFDR